MSLSPLAAAFLSAYPKGIPSGNKLDLFSGIFDRMVYDNVVEEIGYGMFDEGFITLFSDVAETFGSCVESWAFALPKDNITRKVIGRNAYGALVMLESPEKNGNASVVGILDPLTVSYWRQEHCLFANFLGHWLPQKKVIQSFTDNTVFRSMCGSNGIALAPDEILAIKIPLTLGGKMEPANFQVENIHTYYKTTASIYSQLPTNPNP